jgi:hypothetical protein
MDDGAGAEVVARLGAVRARAGVEVGAGRQSENAEARALALGR